MSHSAAADFTKALDPVRRVLQARGYREAPPNSSGFATWILFRSAEADVEFSYGPPEYHVEMFIRRRGRDEPTHELADLMALPAVADWMRANPADIANEETVVAECRWFAGLVEVALRLITPA
jgi:hypothetical protein